MLLQNCFLILGKNTQNDDYHYDYSLAKKAISTNYDKNYAQLIIVKLISLPSVSNCNCFPSPLSLIFLFFDMCSAGKKISVSVK